MICDRYELRDDVMPGAGRHRGGIGVVKKQRVLTSGFITHECDRHTDVPWGIFGGTPGQCGALQIYNDARPDDIRDMPAKFAGFGSPKRRDGLLRPLRGGYGDPLERPPEQVRDDVLDDFCTVEHARLAYGVVVDLDTEGVDLRATEALRSRMRADPRRGEREDSRSASIDRRGDGARPGPQAARAESAADPSLVTSPGEHPPAAAPDTTARRMSPPPAASPAGAPSIEDLVARLNARLGNDWSFDVLRHHRNGGGIEVVAELGANGTRVQRTGASKGHGRLPLGAQLEIASEAAFRSCAAEMLGEAGRISV